MNNKKNMIKSLIAYRGFSSQSLIKVTAMVEYLTYANEIIFVEFCEGTKSANGFKYNTENPIKMSFSAIDLRTLAYAMREILKTKQDSGYEKITKSDGLMKKVTVGFTSKASQNDQNKIIETFYINGTLVQKNFKVGISFSKWEMASFADSLMLIADETETALYKHQRMLRKAQLALQKQSEQT